MDQANQREWLGRSRGRGALMAASGGCPVLLLWGPVCCLMYFQRSAVLSSFCIAGAMPVSCDRTLTVLHLLVCCQRLLIWQILNLHQHPRRRSARHTAPLSMCTATHSSPLRAATLQIECPYTICVTVHACVHHAAVPQGKVSYNEALEIDAFFTNHPERAFQIIYRGLYESRLMSPDRAAVTLGMLLQLMSLALKDEQSVFKSEAGVWVPRALSPCAQALKLSPSTSLRTLFGPIFSYCNQSLHVTCIGRKEYDHERQFLVPYKAALFPDPQQPAEKCSNVQLEAVAAIIDGWTMRIACT